MENLTQRQVSFIVNILCQKKFLNGFRKGRENVKCRTFITLNYFQTIHQKTITQTIKKPFSSHHAVTAIFECNQYEIQLHSVLHILLRFDFRNKHFQEFVVSPLKIRHTTTV